MNFKLYRDLLSLHFNGSNYWPIELTSVLFGPIQSISVRSVLYSYLVHFVLYSVYSGLFISLLWSMSILSGPFCSLWSDSVHSVHFGFHISLCDRMRYNRYTKVHWWSCNDQTNLAVITLSITYSESTLSPLSANAIEWKWHDNSEEEEVDVIGSMEGRRGSRRRVPRRQRLMIPLSR